MLIICPGLIVDDNFKALTNELLATNLIIRPIWLNSYLVGPVSMWFIHSSCKRPDYVRAVLVGPVKKFRLEELGIPIRHSAVCMNAHNA